jgi:hypothetical protein
MSTLYKSTGFNLTTTAITNVYTCPAETETIIKNIQSHNYGGSNVVLEIYISKNGTDYDIAHHTMTAKDSINAVDGVLVLEEGDILKMQAATANAISGLISYLEVRSDTKNPI